MLQNTLHRSRTLERDDNLVDKQLKSNNAFNEFSIARSVQITYKDAQKRTETYRDIEAEIAEQEGDNHNRSVGNFHPIHHCSVLQFQRPRDVAVGTDAAQKNYSSELRALRNLFCESSICATLVSFIFFIFCLFIYWSKMTVVDSRGRFCTVLVLRLGLTFFLAVLNFRCGRY